MVLLRMGPKFIITISQVTMTLKRRLGDYARLHRRDRRTRILAFCMSLNIQKSFTTLGSLGAVPLPP